MAVFYSKVERGNPLKPHEPKKWYAVLKRVTMVKEKEIAKQIADETTINRKEAEMALAQFEKILLRELMNGNSVQLGDWGSFHLSCNSKGYDKKEEVGGECIKKLNIRFTPGKDLKEGIKKATFKDAETLVSSK